MDEEIILKRRFLNKYLTLLKYIEQEFGVIAVERINRQLKRRINILKIFPESGQPTAWENVRSFKINGKNIVFYKLDKKKIAIINMFDLRKHPSKNPFPKK